jgi:hypothetical protein
MSESTPSANGTVHGDKLASELLKTQQALFWQQLGKDRQLLDAITRAEATEAYGDKIKIPEGDDVISITSDSPVTNTHNHYHPAPEKPGLPGWAKAAMVGGAILAAGGLGAGAYAFLRNQPEKPAVSPVQPVDPGSEYTLDFAKGT